MLEGEAENTRRDSYVAGFEDATHWDCYIGAVRAAGLQRAIAQYRIPRIPRMALRQHRPFSAWHEPELWAALTGNERLSFSRCQFNTLTSREIAKRARLAIMAVGGGVLHKWLGGLIDSAVYGAEP